MLGPSCWQFRICRVCGVQLLIVVLTVGLAFLIRVFILYIIVIMFPCLWRLHGLPFSNYQVRSMAKGALKMANYTRTATKSTLFTKTYSHMLLGCRQHHWSGQHSFNLLWHRLLLHDTLLLKDTQRTFYRHTWRRCLLRRLRCVVDVVDVAAKG